MLPIFAKKSETAIPIHVVESDNLKTISMELNIEDWVNINQFKAGLGNILIVPTSNGLISCVLVGWGTEEARSRGRFHDGGSCFSAAKRNI